MKLYSWNVNGIRAVLRKGDLIKFIEQHDPDILCLQETKIDSEQLAKWKKTIDDKQAGIFSEPEKKTEEVVDLPQYREHYFSAVKKGYSGTAIFSKLPALRYIDGFPQDIIDTYGVTGDTYGNPNDEGRVLAAEFDEFWVVTVYTPNSKRDLSRLKIRHEHWDRGFLAYLKQLEQTKPVLCCGDLNAAHTEIDLARPKDNRKSAGFTDEEREGFQQILDADFVDTFRAANPEKLGAYTWWTHWANARANNVGWRIDYWLASKSIAGKVKNPQIHPDVMGSDHCPVSIEL